MANLPASVGFITVTARGLVGLSDSIDVDSQPDAVPMAATVTFVPSITTRPLVGILEADPKPIIPLSIITAEMDTNGDLKPPSDGEDPPSDASGTMRLVAPDGPGLDFVGWYWTANFSPANGQTWSKFSIKFGGSGGETVDLGNLLSISVPSGSPTLTNVATQEELESGLALKQPLDPDLTSIADLDSSTAGAIASDGAGWIKKTYDQFKTALGLVKADVGLSNVDNTSDVNKPVSTAQAAADALKVAKSGDTMTGNLTIDKADAEFNLDGDTGTNARIRFRQNGVERWRLNESSTGNSLEILRYDSSGVLQETQLSLQSDRTVIGAIPFIKGTGSPEGVVTANIGSRYVDTNATGGVVEYVKLSGSGNTGWVASDGSNKVAKSGDTMTGALTIARATSVIQRIMQKDDNPTDAKRWREMIQATSGDYQIASYTDADLLIRNGLRVYRDGTRADVGESMRFYSGSGFPEGVVAAPVGARYIDIASTNGAVEWVKASGSGNTGWRVVYGDTGRRDISSLLINGWTGSLYIRRIGHQVWIGAENLSPAAATNSLIVNGGPVGFHATTGASVRIMANTIAATPIFRRADWNATGFTMSSYNAGDGSYYFQYTTLADVAWPATLPGSSG